MKPSQFCLQFVGQKELPGNKFLDQTPIGKLIHAAGQQDGQAYCAYTAEAMFKACAKLEQLAELDKLFDASAVKTYNNFKKAGYQIGYQPVVDWLVVWQKYVNGVADWRGHCGIVTELPPKDVNAVIPGFISFEGNTGSGDPREGDGFYLKTHMLNGAREVKNGLRLLGFVKVLQ